MKDYRWRLTNKVKRVLRYKCPVVLIAGPQMGKSHMVQLIRESQTPVRILEDVETHHIPSLLERPNPTLITTGINSLYGSVEYKEQCFRVPLTTIMDKHISRWSTVDWNATHGHPALASSSNELLRKRIQKRLAQSWEKSLYDHPQAYEVLLSIREHHASPVEHYQRLRKTYGKELKPILDWLVCLGAIHRQKYKGGAGITATPMHPIQTGSLRPHGHLSHFPSAHVSYGLPNQLNI